MFRRGAFAFALLLPLVVWSSSTATAHPSGGPAIALPVTPDGVGIVVSSTFAITWTDSDLPLRTGTATVDLYRTGNMPPTFPIGTVSPLLEGDLVGGGIKEADPENRYVWDVTGVPSGSYFIWTRVTEPEGEMSLFNIIAFSEGVITVWHPPDPIYPALIFRTPEHAFVTADESLDVVMEVFDPDGSATVRLEGFNIETPETLHLIADALPAQAMMTVPFDTSELADGSWGLKATLTDGRGLSFKAYSRFPFDIVHIFEPPDAGGTNDAGTTTADSGTTKQPVDAGMKGPAPDEGGCTCTAGAGERSTPFGLVILALLAIVRPRSASGGPRASRSRSGSRSS